MGFHGVQMFGLGLIGYGTAAAVNGDYNGRIAALWGLVIVLIGLAVDCFIDDRMERRYHGSAPRP